MKRILYVFKRLLHVDYKKMFKRIKQVSKISKKPKVIIFLDMIWCGLKYSAGYEDYVLFEFYKLSSEKRATYITRGISNQIVKKLNNNPVAWKEFDDKSLFNKKFEKFIGRQWINLQVSTKDQFIDFMKNFDQVIIKPLNEICGKGIQKLDKKEYESLDKMYEYIMATKSFLVEEVIVQHDIMANLYSKSVNTIRVVSILDNDQVHIPFCCVRIGNGQVVDNINNGGMAALIDIKTGKIVKLASDKTGLCFVNHPISKTRILDTQIPMWLECLAMIDEAARLVPEIRYVGWDISITQNGPILIEGNQFPGHDIIQIPAHLDNGIGMLSKYRKIINT